MPILFRKEESEGSMYLALVFNLKIYHPPTHFHYLPLKKYPMVGIDVQQLLNFFNRFNYK